MSLCHSHVISFYVKYMLWQIKDNLFFCWKMDNHRNCLAKWKTTSILRKMEEDLNLKETGIQPNFFFKFKDNLIVLKNLRRPQFVGNWKTISIFGKWKTTIIVLCFKWKTTTVKGKASLACYSFSWAWHSSAPSCFCFIYVWHFFILYIM